MSDSYAWKIGLLKYSIIDFELGKERVDELFAISNHLIIFKSSCVFEINMISSFLYFEIHF